MKKKYNPLLRYGFDLTGDSGEDPVKKYYVSNLAEFSAAAEDINGAKAELLVTGTIDFTTGEVGSTPRLSEDSNGHWTYDYATVLKNTVIKGYGNTNGDYTSFKLIRSSSDNITLRFYSFEAERIRVYGNAGNFGVYGYYTYPFFEIRFNFRVKDCEFWIYSGDQNNINTLFVRKDLGVGTEYNCYNVFENIRFSLNSPEPYNTYENVKIVDNVTVYRDSYQMSNVRSAAMITNNAFNVCQGFEIEATKSSYKGIIISDGSAYLAAHSETGIFYHRNVLKLDKIDIGNIIKQSDDRSFLIMHADQSCSAIEIEEDKDIEIKTGDNTEDQVKLRLNQQDGVTLGYCPNSYDGYKLVMGPSDSVNNGINLWNRADQMRLKMNSNDGISLGYDNYSDYINSGIDIKPDATVINQCSDIMSIVNSIRLETQGDKKEFRLSLDNKAKVTIKTADSDNNKEGNISIKTPDGNENVLQSNDRRLILYHPNGNQFIHSNPTGKNADGTSADIHGMKVLYPNGETFIEADLSSDSEPTLQIKHPNGEYFIEQGDGNQDIYINDCDGDARIDISKGGAVRLGVGKGNVIVIPGSGDKFYYYKNGSSKEVAVKDDFPAIGSFKISDYNGGVGADTTMDVPLQSTNTAVCTQNWGNVTLSANGGIICNYAGIADIQMVFRSRTGAQWVMIAKYDSDSNYTICARVYCTSGSSCYPTCKIPVAVGDEIRIMVYNQAGTETTGWYGYDSTVNTCMLNITINK